MSFSQSARTEKSLCDRLGGQPAIEAVANGLVTRILADGRVNKWFAHALSSPENTAAYKAKLAAFICQSVGGPSNIRGAMRTNRNIRNDAFTAVAEDLAATLDQLKVPAKEKGEVMTIVGSLKPMILQSSSN